MIPIFTDGFIHPLHHENKLSLLYVKQLGGKERILTINHMDGLQRDSFEFLHEEEILTPVKKHLLAIYPFKRVHDMNMLSWWISNNTHTHFIVLDKKWQKFLDLNTMAEFIRQKRSAGIVFYVWKVIFLSAKTINFEPAQITYRSQADI